MGEELREKVKQRYAGAALTVLEGTGGLRLYRDYRSGHRFFGGAAGKRLHPGSQAGLGRHGDAMSTNALTVVGENGIHRHFPEERLELTNQ